MQKYYPKLNGKVEDLICALQNLDVHHGNFPKELDNILYHYFGTELLIFKSLLLEEYYQWNNLNPSERVSLLITLFKNADIYDVATEDIVSIRKNADIDEKIEYILMKGTKMYKNDETRILVGAVLEGAGYRILETDHITIVNDLKNNSLVSEYQFTSYDVIVVLSASGLKKGKQLINQLKIAEGDEENKAYEKAFKKLLNEISRLKNENIAGMQVLFDELVSLREEMMDLRPKNKATLTITTFVELVSKKVVDLSIISPLANKLIKDIGNLSSFRDFPGNLLSP